MVVIVILFLVDGVYQLGCYMVLVWDKKVQVNILKLMKFMNNFGLIIVCDFKGVYYVMMDVIYKVLNDIIVDDWVIIIGGDSYMCMLKGVVFGVDSGIVVLVLVMGEVMMLIL